MEELLIRLYDSEINFQLSAFWDDGFEVRLGDVSNGFIWIGNYENPERCISALTEQVIKYYPESEFAKYIKENYFIIYKKIK